MANTEPTKQNVALGDCILFATADWDEPYWTNKQHCAKELSRIGWRVLYVESLGLRAPKAGSKKDLKRLWLRFRKGLYGLFFGAIIRDENLWVLSPLVVPGAHNHKWLGRLNQLLLQWSLRRHVKAQSFTMPLIWTYHPFMFEAIENLNHGPILYHCVDDLAALPGIDVDAFGRAEDKLVGKAEVVFATAKSIEEKLLEKNPNTFFLANVVDEYHFGKAMDEGLMPVDLAKVPEPRLFYHGVLSDFKVDFDLLIDIAKLKPDWSIVLIGEEREGQRSKSLSALRAMSNVYLLGFKAYEELPNYLRFANVGLLPSRIDRYTKSMFPMKYYEYLAAGVPVVSTPLEFTKTSQEGLIVGDGVNGFIAAVDSQLLRGKLSAIEAKSMVGNNTWAVRTKRMLEVVLCQQSPHV